LQRHEIATRLATSADLPFLDAMQKAHGKALGFFPRAQMEGYVENQWMLIAEDAATRVNDRLMLAPSGKYDVSRQAAVASTGRPPRLTHAA
jgi:hypothetical protein